MLNTRKKGDSTACWWIKTSSWLIVRPSAAFQRGGCADNFSDAEGTIYAKDLDQSEVLFNRKNGVATISFPLQDGRTMLKKWRCDTGPDITK